MHRWYGLLYEGERMIGRLGLGGDTYLSYLPPDVATTMNYI